MSVTCDHCDREATVHEVLVKDGQRIERHLCEVHAEAQGLFGKHIFSGAAQIVQDMVLTKSGQTPGNKTKDLCEGCGMSFDLFRKHGLLGCPACYDAFAEQLKKMLVRAHEGGEFHTGKSPGAVGEAGKRRALILSLQRELAIAVERESYERAAEIRDQIDQLEKGDHAEASTDTPSDSEGAP